MYVIPIIILAAGASSRMRGCDKLLEPVDGMPLLRRTALRAMKVAPDGVFVVLPKQDSDRHKALAGLNVHITHVASPEIGMSESLKAGIASLPKNASAAMILLGDLPDLTVDDLEAVMRSAHATDGQTVWRGATAEGKPGHPIIFARAVFDDILRLKGDTGAQSLAKHATLVPLEGSRARCDLDTPEDWARWRSRKAAREGASGGDI